jgi:hypothetical protein
MVNFFIFIVIVVFYYFIQRWAIYSFYREFLRYRELKEIKDKKNKFNKLTGLYLLSVNKGQSIFLKAAIVLINVQIMFVPLLLIIFLLNINGDVLIKEYDITVKILRIIIRIGWCLIIIHYIIKIRFKK